MTSSHGMGTGRPARAAPLGAITRLIASIGVGLVWAHGSPSYAFEIYSPETVAASGPAIDRLDKALRWNNDPGSLAADGVRGLGGGIEYSVADSLCAQIQPQFLEIPPPSCAEISAMIHRGLNRWAEGHPNLRFTNVSDRYQPTVVQPESPIPAREEVGAEVDIFSLSDLESPLLSGGALAVSHAGLRHAPASTSGAPVGGFTLTNVHIVLNSEACFFIEHDGGDITCNHFESLITHAAGHTLGLANLEHTSFDTDIDPLNPVPISCHDPKVGLTVSPIYDANAIMAPGMNPGFPQKAGLTNDDVAGRDFLYPTC